MAILRFKIVQELAILEQQPPEDNDNTLFNIVAHGLGESGKLISKYHNALKDGNMSLKALNYKNKLRVKICGLIYTKLKLY